MTQTFIDTIIIVSMTGLVIITTGTWSNIGPETGEQASAALMTSEAFSHGLPGEWGHWVVTLGLVFFAFSTLLGWSYYGERALERIFGRRSVIPFRVFWSIIAFAGATTQLSLVWSFSDVMNGLMALPNLIGLLILSGLIARETKAYLKFDPKLIATEPEIRRALAHDPGYQEWLKLEGEIDDKISGQAEKETKPN